MAAYLGWEPREPTRLGAWKKYFKRGEADTQWTLPNMWSGPGEISILEEDSTLAASGDLRWGQPD